MRFQKEVPKNPIISIVTSPAVVLIAILKAGGEVVTKIVKPK